MSGRAGWAKVCGAFRLIAPLGAYLAFAFAAAPSLSAPVPIEVYGRLPALEDVALSPDGSRIAFVRADEKNERIIAVIALADRKGLGGIRLGEVKLRSLEWADADHLLIVTSTTALPWGFFGQEQEWRQLQVYSVEQHRAEPIPNSRRLPESIGLMNVISGQPMVRLIDGHTVLFVPAVYVERWTMPALIRVDLSTGQERVVSLGSTATQQYMVDAGGELVAEQDYDGERQQWTLKTRRDGRLQPVFSGQVAIDTPHLLGFDRDGKSLLLQDLENEQPVWRPVSLGDGKIGAPLPESAEFALPIKDRLTSRMIGGIRRGDNPGFVFFDPQSQQRWDSVVHAFAGDRMRLVSYADDLSKIVVLVDGAQHGYLYELADLDKRRADPVGDVFAGGPPTFEVRPITYPAADALPIPAYLTLPAGRPEKKLPLIVMPHGGPAVHDDPWPYWWAQALANEGYAVLQPNYRGSDLGRNFLSAGFGQWGRKMQTDLSDGVRYLAAQGVIDPTRVCIVGASYGGYAALAGVTLQNGVYRCAVSVAGISDPKRMLEWVNDKNFSRSNYEQRYWDRFMGAHGPTDPALDAISPIRHVDAVTVPVLLIHGRDDTVVPYEQSSVMADALRRAGKNVQLVTLRHEDHWLSRSETRLQMLQATVAFLRSHNPPD
jgi:dipeptidyl aminopeptidase/acylaminoacyl peptidase